jgi:RimJ/RimL family protein N-acetyltransferase
LSVVATATTLAPTAMPIRRLTPADASAFQALRLRGLVEDETAFASSYEEERGRSLEEVRSLLAPTPSTAVFGAFDGEALLGMVGLEQERLAKLSHKAALWGMYVAPEGRGRGLGTQLLKAALEHAWHELRVLQVNLGVHTHNAAALRVYTALGFEIFGTERGALRIRGRPQDEHHMVCRAPGAP